MQMKVGTKSPSPRLPASPRPLAATVEPDDLARTHGSYVGGVAWYAALVIGQWPKLGRENARAGCLVSFALLAHFRVMVSLWHCLCCSGPLNHGPSPALFLGRICNLDLVDIFFIFLVFLSACRLAPIARAPPERRVTTGSGTVEFTIDGTFQGLHPSSVASGICCAAKQSSRSQDGKRQAPESTTSHIYRHINPSAGRLRPFPRFEPIELVTKPRNCRQQHRLTSIP